jgi:hypothetical protein
MGLGGADYVRLREARDGADDCRRLLRNGIDPLKARDDKRAAERLQQARSITFDECARAYIEKNKGGWRNRKHASEWGATLERYASPIFGGLAVQDIDVGLCVRALDGIWLTRPRQQRGCGAHRNRVGFRQGAGLTEQPAKIRQR